MGFFARSRDRIAKLAALDRSQAVIEFAMDGTILNANRNFLDVVGYSLDEIKGRHHRLFVDEATANSSAYQTFWDNLRAGKFYAREYKRLAKGGREIWIQASYNPLLDRGGRPYKVVKFATDITARRLTDADAHGQLEAIGKSQAVIHFSLDGTVLDANANFLEAMGYSLAEIKGKHHSLFVEPAYAGSPEYKEFWRRLARGQYEAAEYKRLAKGGREVWIQASYNPIFDAGGRPFKVVKYATDITKAKLAAADAQGQLSAIGKSYAVIQFNMDGTIIDANDNFLKTMGYTRDEIVGRHHRLFVDEAYAAGADYASFWNSLRAGKFQTRDFRRKAKGGRDIWINASYNPILDMNGKPFKVVKYATDITNATEARINVAGLVEQATVNMQGVASAAEEMSSSVDEINNNMAKSTIAVDEIVMKVGDAGTSSDRLRQSSQSMDKIVNLIRDIAGRVNLLALNATIEAARAGEAGKGFTVVASEVKSLANQTAAATDNISKEIGDMLAVSTQVSDTVGQAVKSADMVRQYVTGVAAALEQQSAATREISRSVQSASGSLSDINDNIKRLAS
jgi:methyl-accepting chemotaxis protein